MDDLKKLLENAGMGEAHHPTPDGGFDKGTKEEQILNGLSDTYQFMIMVDGSIEVSRWDADIHKPGLEGSEKVIIGTFFNFDDMLENFGN